MNKRKYSARWRTAMIAALAATVVFFTARKVDELAADPLAEKDCGPNLPEPAANSAQLQVKATVQLNWLQKGGAINDASCLNRTAVYGVVKVTTVEDIKNALAYARANNLKITIAGVRHSMGGQAFYKNALVLDMRTFNKMALDEANQVLTVQSGATWHAIQSFLHPKLAVKAMQSTDIFTVGGSIAVNAHGMDHQVGALGRTIRAMRVLLPDGVVRTVSRAENAELFNLIVGGYGLFGIVLDVDLDVVDNAIYTTRRRIIDYKQFPAVFAKELSSNTQLGLFYGHLSTASQSLLQEMILYTYEETAVAGAQFPALAEVGNTKLRRFVLNFSKLGDVPMRIKWLAEKYIEPRMEACTVVSRNQAMKDGEACFVSRNEPMHDSVKYLKNNLPNETDILQEYFIPREQFVAFVDGLRHIVTQRDVNLINASVRVVHKEDNFLNYAPRDAFSIVLYINQSSDAAGNAKMQQVTSELIDLSTRLGGRFFLPYQLHYSRQQLLAAYPELDAFFAAKRRYDPDELLTNTFYEKYR
jgi:FAD/FMN-containing dehydrogenase